MNKSTSMFLHFHAFLLALAGLVVAVTGIESSSGRFVISIYFIAAIVSVAALGKTRRTHYSLESFTKLSNFMQDGAYVPSKSDIETNPAFAPAMTPVEWCQKNNVIAVDGRHVDHEMCNAVLMKDLGPKISDFSSSGKIVFSSLPLYARMIILLIDAKRRSRTDYRNILVPMSRMHLEYSDVSKRNEKLEEICSAQGCPDEYLLEPRSRFLHTHILSLYDDTKTRCGIFPSADFLWLKLSSRSLFYALNNHGRSAFLVEGVAAISHYLQEKRDKSKADLESTNFTPIIESMEGHLFGVSVPNGSMV